MAKRKVNADGTIAEHHQTVGRHQLRYQLFPRSVGITDELRAVVQCFETVHGEISSQNKTTAIP